jgi:hypothetical protein
MTFANAILKNPGSFANVDLRYSVQVTKTSSWDILKERSTTKTSAWEISEGGGTFQRTQSSSWDILKERSSTKDSTWIILKDNAVQKTCSWVIKRSVVYNESNYKILDDNFDVDFSKFDSGMYYRGGTRNDFADPGVDVCYLQNGKLYQTFYNNYAHYSYNNSSYDLPTDQPGTIFIDVNYYTLEYPGYGFYVGVHIGATQTTNYATYGIIGMLFRESGETRLQIRTGNATGGHDLQVQSASDLDSLMTFGRMYKLKMDWRFSGSDIIVDLTLLEDGVEIDSIQATLTKATYMTSQKHGVYGRVMIGSNINSWDNYFMAIDSNKKYSSWVIQAINFEQPVSEWKIRRSYKVWPGGS